MTALFSTKELS